MTEPNSPSKTYASLSDRHAAEEALTTAEQMLLDELAGGDPQGGDEPAFYRALEALADDAGRDSATSSDLVDRVMARHLAGGFGDEAAANEADPAPRPPKRRWAWATAGALATVAAFVLFSLRPAVETPPDSAVPPARARLVFVSGTVDVDGVSSTVGDDRLAVGTEIAVRGGHACVAVDPGVSVCIEGESRIRLSDLAPAHRKVEVVRGRAVARLEPQPPGTSFSLHADGVEATAVGTIFALARAHDEEIVTTVVEGAIEVEGRGMRQPLRAGQRLTAADGTLVVDATPKAQSEALRAVVEPAQLWGQPTAAWLEVDTVPSGAAVLIDGQLVGAAPVKTLVSAGEHEVHARRAGWRAAPQRVDVSERESVTLELAAQADAVPPVLPDEIPVDDVIDADPKPAAPRPSAEALITRAQALRSEGKRKQAAQAYRQLLQAYPRRAESRVAAVSLGDLELQLGRGRAALKAYERYLAKPGPLTEEARLGRIRALRALGRDGREQAAIETFLAKHPKSWEAAALQKRLATLRAGEEHR